MSASLGGRIARAAENGLDWGPCHGDMNVKNMHGFGGDGTIFDFDFAAPGWRAYDLAAGPYYAVHEQMLPVWKAFLHGYGELRDLGEKDTRVVPLLHAANRVWSVGLKCERATETGRSRVSDRRLDGLLAFFRAFRTEPPDAIRSVSGSTAVPSESIVDARRPAGLFPVVSSVLAPDALLGELVSGYGLEEPVGCVLWQRGLNDTYLVSSGAERFVARVYRAGYRPVEEIGWELELLEHLAARGVSVSVPLRGGDGCLLRALPAPEGSRQLVLFSYAAGVPLRWESERDSALAGRLAASVHAAADDFVSEAPRRALDLEELLERPLRVLEPFLAHRPDDFRWLVGMSASLGGRIARAAENGLDWGPCHGDFGSGNVHAGGDRRATIFDFDFAAPGWRAYDFVAAWRIGGRDERSTAWRAFLRSYETTRALPWSDRSAVGLFDAAGRIWSFGLRATRARESGAARVNDSYIDGVLTSLQHQGGQDL
jgi:Ser/Thr protein kinase RdoA (MazF antagonist)